MDDGWVDSVTLSKRFCRLGYRFGSLWIHAVLQTKHTGNGRAKAEQGPVQGVFSGWLELVMPFHPLRVCLDGGTRKDEEGWDDIILT